jgi:ACS family glucarate transporter-like MFS transporter
VPLFCGGLGSLVSGTIALKMAKWTGSVRKGRRVMACTGFLGAAVLLVISINLNDPMWGMAAMGMASFFNDLVMPPAWGSCMDVGGKFAGTVAGSMNMMGNLAGFCAPVLGGFLLPNWNALLYTMAVVYLLGTLCWPFIDPVTPMEQGSD